MNRRLRRTLASALCLLTVGVTVPLAYAAPKDAEAQKLDKQAMDDDYLNVKFDEAEKKLRNALNICGASGCDPKIKAKLYMHLGIILVNAKKNADGTAAFAEGLKLDASAAPEPDFASDDVKKAFDAAKGSGTAPPPSTTTPPPATSAPPTGEVPNDLKHEPITEAQANVPVAVYVGAADGASKMALFYKAPGSDFKKLDMKKMGKGFGATIPCEDVKIAGKVSYYIVAQDNDGSSVGGAGSKKQPIVFELKNKISGDPPSFPGQDPPAKCKGAGECVPGLNEEGCKEGLTYGSKCTGPGQCKKADGLACVEGTCQPGKEEGDDDGGNGGDEGTAKLNLLSIAFSVDDAIVSGGDLCSADSYEKGTYTCFRQDKGNRLYHPGKPGDPANYASRDKGSIAGPPFAVGTFRILIGYDRAIPLKGQAFTPAIGVRVGYAFNGGPAVPSTDGEKKFLPFHAELRASMYFGKNVLARRGVRPYIFVGGGLAQVDAKISSVPVSDDCDITQGDTCPTGQKKKILVDAYRKMGTGFVGLGGGMVYAINKQVGLMVEIKGAFFVGSSGIAISPSLGFVGQL